jgi:hypothetical protein
MSYEENFKVLAVQTPHRYSFQVMIVEGTDITEMIMDRYSVNTTEQGCVWGET